MATKAFAGRHSIVKLYLEMESDAGKVQEILEDKIHQAFCSVDDDYSSLAEMMSYRPLKLVPVIGNAFKRLSEKHLVGGNDAVVKLERVNPPKRILEELVGRKGE